MSVKVYFSDYFGISPSVVESYGALNISLINDLPLFIDPFLLYESDKPEYKKLHQEIIDYVVFLKQQAVSGTLLQPGIERWFYFSERETKQNWLGFSVKGNKGSGLGDKFAQALAKNFRTIFSDFGEQTASQGVHVEKLCLLKEGIGKDNISDLTTTLIKKFLLDYTQTFAQKHLMPHQRRFFMVNKVSFDYKTKRWQRAKYELPMFKNDYVILTPKDILTKEDTWINRMELQDSCVDIATSIPNSQLRLELSEMLIEAVKANSAITKTDLREIATALIERHPVILDYFIRYKEETGEGAKALSAERVGEVEEIFIHSVRLFVERLDSETDFYRTKGTTYDEVLRKAHFLKDVIENKDGYRLFYHDGKPITRENDLQILFRLTWDGTESDVNREVNNGRGPVDFAISRGKKDKTNVEFKLASNSKLKQNLEHQPKIYARAGNAQRTVKIIVHFNVLELNKVKSALKALGMDDDESVVLIDASSDKPSASKAKTS